MNLSLRIKFGILLAAFGILASGVTGFYFYDLSRTMMVRAAEDALQTDALVLGRRFSIALREVAGNARMLAELPAAARADPAGRQDLTDTFTALMKVHPEYFQVRLIGAASHGRELVRVDRDGRGLTRVGESDLQEKGHFPYVFRTLRLSRGELHLSKIGINREQGAHAGQDKPTLRVATPVVPELEGGAKGVVVVNVDLNGLFDLLKKDLPSDFGLYLANAEGDFLIHPDAAQAFAFDHGRRLLLQDTFVAARSLFDGNAEAAVASLATSDGKGGMVAAFRKLPFGDAEAGQYVVIGLSQPMDQVLAGTRGLGGRTLQMVLIFSVLAILLSYGVSRYMTRHLNMIVQAVKRFSSEHVMGELPLHRRDEIGLLARSFHDMQVELKAHLAEVYESKRQLDHLARHDTLTGLPNRMMFHDTLEHEMAAARRNNKRLAVFFIDLDRFKEINDGLGHAVGDEVLKTAARRFRAMVREVDTVARLGGDEFILLLTSLEDVQHLPAIARKIIDATVAPIQVGPHELQVSASLGVSLYPTDAATGPDLVHKADLAMYQAKSGGRNAYRFYAEGMENDQ